MDESTRDRAAAIFAALGNPGRLAVVQLVVDEEMTVNEIAHTLKIGQSTASMHLSCLTRAGVLTVTQRGTHRYYRARGPRIGRILKLVRKYCDIHGLEGKPERGPMRAASSLAWLTALAEMAD